MTPDRARPSRLPEATLRELVAWLGRARRRFAVVGPSMEPTLAPGDVVLLDPRAYRTSAPQPGDLVVLSHPTTSGLQIIKRVDRVEVDGRVRVVSDNRVVEAADSRTFGPVAPELVLGRVTARIGR